MSGETDVNGRGTMAEQWESFARSGKLDKVSRVQRVEMRRAFYAGAVGCLDTINSFLGSGPEATEGEVDRLEALGRELLEFSEVVGTPAEDRDRRPQ